MLRQQKSPGTFAAPGLDIRLLTLPAQARGHKMPIMTPTTGAAGREIGLTAAECISQRYVTPRGVSTRLQPSQERPSHAKTRFNIATTLSVNAANSVSPFSAVA